MKTNLIYPDVWNVHNSPENVFFLTEESARAEAVKLVSQGRASSVVVKHTRTAIAVYRVPEPICEELIEPAEQTPKTDGGTI